MLSTKVLTTRLIAAAVVATVAAAAITYEWRAEVSLRARLAAQQQSINELEKRLDTTQVDWPAVAQTVEASVVTVEAGDSLGSAWVAHADTPGSDLVTNFHVVADQWSAGSAAVQVRQGDSTWPGTVVRVDRNDDLAIVHVSRRLPVLTVAPQRPRLGTTVMAVGSPLGLDGTISIGVVSGYRSLEGSNYLQFTAAISPGNSGGPVIDARGRVVAIAAAKFSGVGVEDLSLGIPVTVACDSVVVCTVSHR